MSLLISRDPRAADAAMTHTLRVTPDNFVRAETDMQFMSVVKRGGFGRLVHEREFSARQVRPWADSDVLRSRGVWPSWRISSGPVADIASRFAIYDPGAF